MSFVGKGWRSGQGSDTTVGAASTATVGSLTPNTAARTASPLILTVTGTGFVSGALVYANFAPIGTVFVSATSLRVDRFVPMPDSGVAGPIPIGVRNPGQKLSATINFTAT